MLPGDPGEILLRGPNVFAGYFEDPEATGSVLDAAGWLHTGDIAVMGEGGELTIVDRHKDLIIVSGFNVFPAEVEQVLMKHPDVAEAAVVGVPDPGHGESGPRLRRPAAGAVVRGFAGPGRLDRARAGAVLRPLLGAVQAAGGGEFREGAAAVAAREGAAPGAPLRFCSSRSL